MERSVGDADGVVMEGGAVGGVEAADELSDAEDVGEGVADATGLVGHISSNLCTLLSRLHLNEAIVAAMSSWSRTVFTVAGVGTGLWTTREVVVVMAGCVGIGAIATIW